MGRPQTWVVAEHENGDFSVWHGNRPVATGLSDQHVGLDLVRRSHKPGEKVYTTETDGYRTNRTKSFTAAEATDRRSHREGPASATRAGHRHLRPPKRQEPDPPDAGRLLAQPGPLG